MGLLLAVTGWDPGEWLNYFKAAAPGMAVYDATGPYDPKAIRYAAVWRPAPGLLAALPNLAAVFNLGAGVDAIMADATVPPVPLVRIVDPDLTQRMTEWVVWQVLHHHRHGFRYAATQAARQWTPIVTQAAAADVRVGIMGMGELGRDSAAVLMRLGFQVAGWSRSGTDLAGVESFAGEGQLDAFLARTDILVVLLPLTKETRWILDREHLSKLAKDGRLGGPVLINAGRGGLQVEADILAALDDGTLLGASLDVFETEPLPVASPLWTHPRVVVTPHVAAESDPQHLARYVAVQIARLESGLPLQNQVDRAVGY